MKVAILAGGLGTRLGDAARHLPKPMVEVAGKPFLEHVLRSFLDCGLREFVLLMGHRGEQIEGYFGSGERIEASIEYSREASPVGTGGAVHRARALLGERFLLTYGDVYRRFDYDRFVREHQQRPCLAVYAGAGNTEIANGKVIRFDKNAALPWVDAGFCLMPSSVIEMLGATGSFEQTVFPRLAAAQELDAEIVDLDFVEIGTPDALAHARRVMA